MVNRRTAIWISIFGLTGIAFAASAVGKRLAAEALFAREAGLARAAAAEIQATSVLYTEGRVRAGIPFLESLAEMGVEHAAAQRVVNETGRLLDLRRIRAGNRLCVGRGVRGDLRAVRYQVDSDRELALRLKEGVVGGEIRTVPSTLEIARVSGRLEDSLFNAVTGAGERPELAMMVAELFGWDLDFYSDPRHGDTFRLAVEKKIYRNGQAPAYGKILAAEYVNAGEAYQAVLFRDAAGKPAYYAADGSSLQKAFLRSPLKFSAAVTSHFSRSRLHPILRRRRAHLGTDYAAPAGTPVQAIGEGRVVFAGSRNGSGRMVHLKHTNGYETQYLHLSRVLVHAGARVEQGERIGLVGSTGLATGPHLDFRISQNGAYRNFESLRLPPAQPVARKDWEEFVALRDKQMTLLPAREPASKK